jgi:hypothetical protein
MSRVVACRTHYLEIFIDQEQVKGEQHANGLRKGRPLASPAFLAHTAASDRGVIGYNPDSLMSAHC